MPIPFGVATARPSHGSGGLDGLMLDIGGDVGALVVYVGPALVDRQIEVRPAGAPAGHRTHTVVHEHGRAVFAAVFVELHASRYTLRHPDDDNVWGEVLVEGGRIAELDRRPS
jgi:hypothetical protein